MKTEESETRTTETSTVILTAYLEGTDFEEEQTEAAEAADGTASLDVEENRVSEEDLPSETDDQGEAGSASSGGTVSVAKDVSDEPDKTDESADEIQAAAAAVATVAISRDAVTDNEDPDAGEESEQPDEEEKPEPDKDPEIEEIKKRIRERKREKRRKARIRKVRFWTVLSLVLFALAGFIFSISGFFTVDSIEVRGNSHFTAEEIINIAHAVPGHNLLYDTGSTSIVEYLTQNPYIKSADVKRKLPSTLVISVKERSQACTFSYDDDYLVLDDEGILLKKTRTQPKTTTVTGLVVTKMKLGEVLGTQNQQMFSRLMRLIRLAKASDIYFVSIDMSSYEEDRTVYAYIYDKLVVRTSYDLLSANLKNGRLHRVIEKLFEDGVQRGTITFSEDGTASFMPGI